MKKVVLEFNESAFLAKKNEISNRTQQKNEAVEIIKRITKDAVKSLDVANLANYLNRQSGFQNAEMSAKAFNVVQDFDFVRKIASFEFKD